jgi:hypothetical protein
MDRTVHLRDNVSSISKKAKRECVERKALCECAHCNPTELNYFDTILRNTTQIHYFHVFP